MSARAIAVSCACPPDISYVRLFKISLIPNLFEIDSTRLFILLHSCHLIRAEEPYSLLLLMYATN